VTDKPKHPPLDEPARVEHGQAAERSWSALASPIAPWERAPTNHRGLLERDIVAPLLLNVESGHLLEAAARRLADGAHTIEALRRDVASMREHAANMERMAQNEHEAASKAGFELDKIHTLIDGLVETADLEPVALVVARIVNRFKEMSALLTKKELKMKKIKVRRGDPRAAKPMPKVKAGAPKKKRK